MITLNRQFINDFTEASAPCCALGLVRSRDAVTDDLRYACVEAQLSNAVRATHVIQQDPNRIFGWTVLASGLLYVFDDLLAGALQCLSHRTLLVTTMNNIPFFSKSSYLAPYALTSGRATARQS